MTLTHYERYETLMGELSRREWRLDSQQNDEETYIRLKYYRNSPKEAMKKLAKAKSTVRIWRGGKKDDVVYYVRVKG